MKIGDHVIIKKKGNHYNMVALLIDIKGHFGTVQVNTESHPITISLSKLKEVRSE